MRQFATNSVQPQCTLVQPKHLSRLVLAAWLPLTTSFAGGAFAADLADDVVVVTANRQATRSFNTPAAIDAVDAQAIQEAGMGVNASEVLARVPGLAALNRQNAAQDLQISIRGFGSRSTFGVRGVKLIVDGIPSSMPDGQGQAANIALGSTQRIEVLRGPAALLYGNAAGGVIQAFTEDGPAQPVAQLSLAGGSQNSRQLGLKVAGQADAVNYVVNWTRFETDGYRDHSESRREQLNAKIRYDASRDTRFTLLLNTFNLPLAMDPLGLTQAQVDSNPRQAGTNALAQNTRKTIEQQQYGLVMDHALNANNQLTARVYGGTRAVTQWQSIPLASQSSATHPGGVIDLDRSYQGAALAWHTRTASGVQFTVGADYDLMNEHRRGFINNAGVSGALRRDEDNTVSSTNIYALGSYAWQDLRVQAGVRATRVAFETQDHYIVTGNPDDSGNKSYQQTNPVLGLTWHLNDRVNFYANLGKGFETPTFAELAYRPDGSSGLNYNLNASRSQHVEIGTKAKLTDQQRLDLALFSIKTEDELVVASNAGGRSTFRNGGSTRREGVEAAWRAQWGEQWTSQLALTWLKATFLDNVASSTNPITAGNRLPGAPEQVAFGELVWRPTGAGPFGRGFHTALEMVSVGKIYANDSNAQAAPARTTFNWRAGFEQSLGAIKLREFVRVDNLSDKQYIGSVIVNEANGRYFEPAPGRTWMIGLSGVWSF